MTYHIDLSHSLYNVYKMQGRSIDLLFMPPGAQLFQLSRDRGSGVVMPLEMVMTGQGKMKHASETGDSERALGSCNHLPITPRRDGVDNLALVF